MIGLLYGHLREDQLLCDDCFCTLRCPIFPPKQRNKLVLTETVRSVSLSSDIATEVDSINFIRALVNTNQSSSATFSILVTITIIIHLIEVHHFSPVNH